MSREIVRDFRGLGKAGSEFCFRGTSVAQSITRLTLDLGSGHDLAVREFEPSAGFPLPLPCSFSLSLSLSPSLKINRQLKKKNTVFTLKVIGGPHRTLEKRGVISLSVSQHLSGVLPLLCLCLWVFLLPPFGLNFLAFRWLPFLAPTTPDLM